MSGELGSLRGNVEIVYTKGGLAQAAEDAQAAEKAMGGLYEQLTLADVAAAKVDGSLANVAASAQSTSNAIATVNTSSAQSHQMFMQTSSSAGLMGQMLGQMGAGAEQAGGQMVVAGDGSAAMADGFLDSTNAVADFTEEVVDTGANVVTTGNKIVKFGQLLNALPSNLDLAKEGAQQAANAFGPGAGMVGRLLLANPALAATALAVGGVYLAVKTLGPALVSVGENFASLYKTVQVGTGETGEGLAQLKDDFRAVYGNTSAEGEKVAEVLSRVSTATGQAGEPLQVLTQNFLKLEKIGVDASVENVTRLFGDWGIAVENQSGVMDHAFKIYQNTGVSVDRLAELAVAGGATFRSFGFSVEETTAMFGRWEKEGVNTEIVIGGLKKATASFGREGKDLRVGLEENIEAIKNASSASEAWAIAAGVVGADAASDWADTIRGGKLDMDEFMATIAASPDTIDSAAASVSSFAGAQEKLAHQIEVALEPIGSVWYDVKNRALTSMAEMKMGMVSSLSPALESVGGFMKAAAAVGYDFASGLRSILGIIGAAVGAVWDLVDAGAQLLGGWETIVTVLGIAGAAVLALAAPITIVVAAVGGLVMGIGALNRETTVAQKSLAPLATDMASYGAAVDKAAGESGVFASILAGVRGALEAENAEVSRNSLAYLKYSVGASDAVLKSDELKEAKARLTRQLLEGKITTEQFEAAMVSVADAVSVAAGEGRLLTAEQEKNAASMASGLSELAAQKAGLGLAAQQSQVFQERLALLSEEFAQGKITSDQAKQGILEFAGSLAQAQAQADASSPAGLAAAKMSEFAQGFGVNVASILNAGAGLALGEAERAKKMVEIEEALNTSVSEAMTQMWQTRLSFNDQFAEARAKDAEAQKAAQLQVQQGQAEHNAKIADLEAKLAGETGDKAAKIQQDIAQEQQKWAAITGIAQTGSGEAVAEVQKKYDEERATIRESLAQTVIDHLNAMVMMGDVSLETAKGVYGALATAYPGVEVINPATEATLEFNATLSQVLEGDKDPEAIVSAINNVETAMVESDATNRESLGIQQQTWDGMLASAQSGSEGVVAATQATTDAVTTATADQAAQHEDAAAAAAGLSQTLETEAGKQTAAANKTRTGVATAMGVVRNELTDTGAGARSVGSDFDSAFSGLGERAAGGVRGVGRALDEVQQTMGKTTEMAQEIGAVQVEGFGSGADAAASAAGGIVDAAGDIGQGMGDAQTDVEDLGAAIEALPTEVEIPVAMPGMEQSLRQVQQLQRDLAALKPVKVGVETTHIARDAATREGGSFAMEHWLEDLFAVASSDSVVINSQINDSSSGLLSTTDSTGTQLTWQGMLQRMAAQDYPIRITASMNVEDLDERKRELLDKKAEIEDELSRVSGKMQDAWNPMFALLREIDAADLPAFIAGLELPEGIETLDQLIAHFQSLEPGDQIELWKLLFDDMKEMQDKAFDDWKRDQKDKEEIETRRIEAISRRIEELRKKGEEDAKEPGADPFTEIEGLDDEINAANRQLLDILKELDGTVVGADGLAFNIKKEHDALEDFYKAVTGGARTGIFSSEELLEAIKLLQETAKQQAEDLAKLEEEKHQKRLAALEQIGKMTDRQFEDWKAANAELIDNEKALADLEKERLERRKEFEKEIKDAAKSLEDDEKTAHKMILDSINERKDAERELYEARLDALDELKEKEQTDHEERLKRIKAEGEREHEKLEGMEAALRKAKLEEQRLQIAAGGLDEAKRVLSELQKAISRLPKSDKRERPGDKDRFGATDIGLSQDAMTAAMEAKNAAGESALSASARRRLAILQGGGRLGIKQLRELMDEMEKALETTEDVKTDELDAQKKIIAEQEYAIALEKERLVAVDERIKNQIEEENARHDAEMKNIEDRRKAEQQGWEDFQKRLEDAKKAEDARHEAKLRQIAQELRAKLLAQGFEAGEDPEVALARAREIADRYSKILGELIGDSTLKPGLGVAPGGGVTPVPGVPPGAPGPILPPPGPGPGPIPISEMFSGEPASGQAIQALSQAFGSALVSSAAPLAAAMQNITPAVTPGGSYYQYGPLNVIDGSEMPKEVIDTIKGIISLRAGRSTP